jgi:phytoene synthase
VKLIEKRGFEEKWVESFLNSMEADLSTSSYENLEKLKEYLYGSAEVVGLMMAKIMELPRKSYKYAMLLGRAMQYVNFIRDISEDLLLGRNYFPYEEMEYYRLDNLEYNHVIKRRENFDEFIKKQISRYFQWQKMGVRGYEYIPNRYLIPIKTASQMYYWTANIIKNNPLVVYQNKVKPSILRIIGAIGHNTILNGRTWYG